MQNSGQGLGFKLGHTVIDRKTLTSAAAKLVTGFTMVYTALVALAFLLAPTLGGRPALPHTLMCAAAAILANGTVQFTHFLGTHQPGDEQRDDAP